MFRSSLFIFSTLLYLTCLSQQHKNQTDSANIYKIYSVQFGELLKTRGASPNDIDQILKKYASNNIRSDRDFALTLEKFYNRHDNVAIIVYFFNGDSLRRVLFIPGAVLEQKTIKITKNELLTLGHELNYVIGLYSSVKNRMPQKRGIELPEPPISKKIKYDSIIRKATKILLPDSLDKKNCITGKNCKNFEHLLIIPALNIGTFPFALLKPFSDTSGLLIDSLSYTIVPSIIDLLGLRGRIAKKYSNLSPAGDFGRYGDMKNIFPQMKWTLDYPLFISNPEYPKNTSYEFPDLPGAKKEIENALFYATKEYKLFEGREVIKDSILKYIRKSDLAYFATHGIADSVKPMENSFLVLSGKDPFLTARDIMNLRNDTTYGTGFPEMVILSACQTGLGKMMESGVAGLARSFILAGSNHIIMSLWNVDDNATAYLMNRFLYYLQQRNRFTPSEPLRKAMLDTRNKFPNPYQWASFSLFGIDF